MRRCLTRTGNSPPYCACAVCRLGATPSERWTTATSSDVSVCCEHEVLYRSLLRLFVARVSGLSTFFVRHLCRTCVAFHPSCLAQKKMSSSLFPSGRKYKQRPGAIKKITQSMVEYVWEFQRKEKMRELVSKVREQSQKVTKRSSSRHKRRQSCSFSSAHGLIPLQKTRNSKQSSNITKSVWYCVTTL